MDQSFPYFLKRSTEDGQQSNCVYDIVRRGSWTLLVMGHKHARSGGPFSALVA